MLLHGWILILTTVVVAQAEPKTPSHQPPPGARKEYPLKDVLKDATNRHNEFSALERTVTTLVKNEKVAPKIAESLIEKLEALEERFLPLIDELNQRLEAMPEEILSSATQVIEKREQIAAATKETKAGLQAELKKLEQTLAVITRKLGKPALPDEDFSAIFLRNRLNTDSIVVSSLVDQLREKANLPGDKALPETKK